jgi:hypothetical protein
MSERACDECGRERATLYERARHLVCLFCLPVESLFGSGALKAIRAAVTGAVNIERRRRALAKVK